MGYAMPFPLRAIAGLLMATSSLNCCAANLLINPNFATGLSGWVLSKDTSSSVTFDATSGSPSKGSAHFQSANGDAAQLRQCIAIPALSHIDFIARLHVVSAPSAFSGVSVLVNAFSNSHCTLPSSRSLEATGSTPGFAGFLNGAAQMWDEVSALNQPLPEGTQSVSVTLYAISSSGFDEDVYVDSILLQPTATSPVTLQSFSVD
jgi:hypothetical protein